MSGYRIEIVRYDPRWPQAYEAERDRLAPILKDHVLRFEHMGSTAVPGLDSKPIIDISAAVRDLDTVPALFPALSKLGYHPIKIDAKDRYDLWRQVEGNYPSHILHFMVEGSDAWNRPLIFRNALRADPTLREEYAALKRKLAQECLDDIVTYGRGKSDFILRVLNDYMSQSAS